MFRYGEALVLGDQVTKDEATGVVFLRRAADLGEPSAAFRLGKLMDDGSGLPRDLKRALGYYRAAAAGGVGEAFFNLGAAYASGRGVKRDYAEALAWLILAREAGITNSGESQVRARISAAKRPDWLTRGEARVAELQRELEGRSVREWVDLAEGRLPPPAVAAPAVPEPVSVRPSTAISAPAVLPVNPVIAPPAAFTIPAPEVSPSEQPRSP
jgi:TPR repeat protein